PGPPSGPSGEGPRGGEGNGRDARHRRHQRRGGDLVGVGPVVLRDEVDVPRRRQRGQQHAGLHPERLEAQQRTQHPPGERGVGDELRGGHPGGDGDGAPPDALGRQRPAEREERGGAGRGPEETEEVVGRCRQRRAGRGERAAQQDRDDDRVLHGSADQESRRARAFAAGGAHEDGADREHDRDLGQDRHGERTGSAFAEEGHHQGRPEEPEVADRRGGGPRARRRDGGAAKEPRDREHEREDDAPGEQVAAAERRVERGQRPAADEPEHQGRQREAERERAQRVERGGGQEAGPRRRPAEGHDAEDRKGEPDDLAHPSAAVRRSIARTTATMSEPARPSSWVSRNRAWQASSRGEAMPARRASSGIVVQWFSNTPATAAWIRKSRSTSLRVFTRDTLRAMGPASTTAANRSRARPWASAKWVASTSPVTIVMRKTLTAYFISSAFGTGPHSTAARHTGPSSGRTRSTAAGSPASIATSCPVSAGTREPETGAST